MAYWISSSTRLTRFKHVLTSVGVLLSSWMNFTSVTVVLTAVLMPERARVAGSGMTANREKYSASVGS